MTPDRELIVVGIAAVWLIVGAVYLALAWRWWVMYQREQKRIDAMLPPPCGEVRE